MAIFKGTEKLKKSILYSALFLVLSIASYAQQGSDTATFVPQYRHGVLYTIETTVGTKHSGFVVDETKDLVVIENRVTRQKTEINKSQIIQTNKSRANKKSRYEEKDILGDNYHAGQYMVSGSAFLFREGDIYSTTHYFLMQQADFSISSNWAVTINSLWFYPLGVGFKYAYKIDDLNYFGFTTGAFGKIFRSGSSPPTFWAYHAQLHFTHGTENKNFSLSAGILPVNLQMLDPSSSFSIIAIPFAGAAYANRFSEKFVFNGEAWLFPLSMVALAGAGVKYLPTERIAWTFGCYTNVVSERNTLKLDTKSIPIPYFAYARRFR
jgi:RNase P/RNase MRP subunit p29